jgi:glucose dehydrogenase
MKGITQVITNRMKKTLSNTSMRALALAILFIISGIGASLLINPAAAAPNAAPAAASISPSAAAAPSALTQAEANWATPNGNQANQDYNPQVQINSSNAQYLGLNWLFPIPSMPSSLSSFGGGPLGEGVGQATIIVNGTIYAVTNYGQIFALNAATGDVEWTDLIPLSANSTAGIPGISGLMLHLHEEDEQFTTTLFNNTPTYWVSSPDLRVYAIDALNGMYELNFSVFPNGIKGIAGDNPNAVEGGSAGILVDQSKGILISSVESGVSAVTGRCFFRGWNVLVNPPQLMWTSFCTAPQPGGNLPVDPSWDIEQIKNMTGAEIFYPGPADNVGGYFPNTNGQAVVNLKTLSPSQLNSTLYNDWGYADQTAQCSTIDAGGSTGSTAAAWGGAWLLGSGPTSGMAFVPTDNRDPYNSVCTTGPGLWAASIMALNESTGAWIWGFQATPHDIWDWDCSWWQAAGNETINGAQTPVIWKTCKNGYLYEINALTGNLIWAWDPPSSYIPRCPVCYILNPLNQTQMDQPFFNPSLQPALMYPSLEAGFEDEQAYSPTLNTIFAAAHNVPMYAAYVPFNSSNYATNSGMTYTPVNKGTCAGCGVADNNATIFAINASSGAIEWHYFVPDQGYRGGVMTSGNLVFLSLSSGNLIMLNAKTGGVVKNVYIGGPLNVLTSVGATVQGQEELVLPISVGFATWGNTVPGDIVALTLQSASPSPATTVTASGSVSVTTVTASGSSGGGGGVTTTSATAISTAIITAVTTVVSTAPSSSSSTSSTAFYAAVAVAVIFIIATGYLAMRGRGGRRPVT